ncbi:MAG: hypothetical protein CL512_06070 [Actinobacteria bacterium]|nr:hypothetical protein [Actinomycetota bacterium]
MSNDPLDDFFLGISTKAHGSSRKLAKVVRSAYPIGVPALIMKSSTDRYGDAAGYSFHLGTPDINLRRIASWLLTNAGSSQEVLLTLVSRLWRRHGREDIALAALLLANIDHASLNSDPWKVLASNIGRKEPAEALLLVIEELFRAGRKMPELALLVEWCTGKSILGHLVILVLHAGSIRGEFIDPELSELIQEIKVPEGDSLLGRIKARLVTT